YHGNATARISSVAGRPLGPGSSPSCRADGGRRSRVPSWVQRRSGRTSMATLDARDKAPAFTLPDQDGAKVSLKDFAGRRVVVYFYPADDTPGCTKEACQFNDNLRAFTRADVTVIGISPDGAEKHVRFRTKYGLIFPLLSDPDHKVMEK